MQVYLDNAATTWPKPQAVTESMQRFLRESAASPGRSAHRFSLKAAREIFECRELLAGYFQMPDSSRVIFTGNATQALNIAIKGVLKPGDHVITTAMEHNSVIRPLRRLEQEGVISLSIVPCDRQGIPDSAVLKSSFRKETRMLVSIFASNVNGQIMPVEDMCRMCREKGVLSLIDASQAAGIYPIRMQDLNIDLLAFSGHKKLYGPTGTGVLCVNTDEEIRSLTEGGSGSRSEHETHPDFYPDRLESGTPNTLGIAGLKAGIAFLQETGMESLLKQQRRLMEMMNQMLEPIGKLTLYYAKDGIPMLSLNIAGMRPDEAAYSLEQEFGIMVRAGLHCAPLAHRSLGTFPQGSVRISPSCFTTEEEIAYSAKAIIQLAG